MKKNKRNEKGFTMVELIIVVALMAIIGAVLVPAFGNMATKAKISADISTVKTIKRLVDAYNAESTTALTASTDAATDIGTKLYSAGYLESSTISLQTNGKLIYTVATGGTAPTPSKLVLDLSSADEDVKAVANKMITSEPSNANWIKTS